ncbi:MAG: phosphoglycerate kinase [Pelagibacteraceae bacterium]|jgi:phosphoglycerate kinase|nr:phosphoglycerate kinase [Candidatus Pelagibacter sp.]MDP6680758.1 phosphoglycerate kinase [Pelagibacteraceae bacterium]MDP6710265.1 phosphoglycerate kinase [Pelagibacteraceae bacterium]
MSKLKALDEKFNLADKRVLLRVDLNVPITNGKVTDKSKINKIVPVIKELISRKTKIILISHLGRPKGKIDQKLSLKVIAPILGTLLNSKVHFFNENYGSSAIEKSKKISSGEVLLLENIRFNKEEELNGVSLAKELSKIGDIYINEAFSCSHRAHASVCEITKHIDSYAGKLLAEEVNVIKMLTSNAKKPVTCIVGGAKISTKIGIINNLMKKITNIIIVGAMANNFIKYQGYNIGKSLFEKNQEKLLKDILKQCEINNCNLILPEDVIVSKDYNSKGQLKSLNKIGENDLILDIGKKTIENILNKIDESKTVLWNGPAGYFEVEEFSLGSNKIANKIVENTKKEILTSIAGGGDTVAAINKFGCSNGFTYISTAGGAFLEFLEGKKLPGINALEINE